MATTEQQAAPFVGTNPNLTANKEYINAVYQYAKKTAAPQSVLDQWTGKTVADVTKGIWGEGTGSWKYVSGQWGTNFGYGATPPAQTTEDVRQPVPGSTAPEPTAAPPAPLYDPAKLGGTTPAPQVPDLTAIYQQMRSTYKIDDAEQAVSDAQAALDQLDAAYMMGKHAAGNALAPMEVIRGEQGRLNEQYNEKRFIQGNLLQAAQNSLATKQNMVQFMMDLTDKNYDNARQAYDDNFSHNMDVAKFMYNAQKDDRDYARLISNDIADREYQRQTLQLDIDRAARQDAQANLTTLTNMITDSGKTWSQLDPKMKTQINDLELRAGLPVGTMQAFYTSKPNAKLLAQVEDGNGNISFIYANPDGTPGIVKTVKGVGNVESSGSGSTSTSIATIEQSKDASGGLSFTATDKSGNVTSVTASQYAAKYKKNIFSILSGGNSGDKELAAGLQADLQAQAANKVPTSTVLATLQSAYPYIFNGITASEFAAMTGYVPAK